ncbi:MAG: TrkH family potassium uptake protein, partial [Muribaculaceae bacterium]|nr:TrkH family potassium uptake protein [Muribaculaceae bacterium]
VKKAVAPKRVYVVRVNGRVVPEDDLARISAFTTIYFVLILIGVLIVTAYGISLDDAFFAVISCVGNNGLGYGLTGAAGGYHLLPDAVKWVLSLMMLTGRLERFSELVLFIRIFRSL